MKIMMNKVVTLLTGVAMMFSFTSSTESVATNSNPITKSYYKYDIESNTRTLYELTVDVDYSTQARSLNDIDGHVRDGHNGIVYVGGGTGFIVGDHVIATAAHLVNFQLYVNNQELQERFEHSYYFYDTVDIFTYDTGGVPESYTVPLTPVEIHIPVEYLSDAPGSDYALITVEEDLSQYTQFNLGVPYEVNSELDVFITGVPQETPDGDPNTGDRFVYTGKGKITGLPSNDNDSRIYHSCGAVGGYSGSPLYLAYQYTSNNEPKTIYSAIGIQTGGTAASRMTSYKLQFYRNNPNLSYVKE